LQPDLIRRKILRKDHKLLFNSNQNREAGDYYLNEVFRWPTDVTEHNGLTGIIVLIYNSAKKRL
jgi:hypothetical protein